VFTALGVVCALMGALAAVGGQWEQMFLWLGVALAIDGIDGTIARRVGLPGRLPRFSGDRLDLVIDYATYVFVPTLALLLGKHLQGAAGVALASLILLSSLFHFSDTESKTEDHCFVGFPAIWNIVAFYVFAFDLGVGATAAVVLACAALTFVPLKWAHPMRVKRWQPVTVAMSTLWAVAAAAILWSGFPAGPWTGAILLAGAAYAAGLTLFQGRAR
jgi:phosphatidylcholine synthase